MEGEIRGVQETVPPTRRPSEQDAERPIAGRLGQGFAYLSCGSKGHGDARILGKNSERPGQEYPLVDWRIGGPGQIQQDKFDLRRCGRVLPESVSLAKCAFRRARAR